VLVVLAACSRGNYCKEAKTIMDDCGFGPSSESSTALRSACDAGAADAVMLAKCLIVADRYEQTRGCSQMRFMTCVDLVSRARSGRL
jgi:hypothetical protein